MQNISKIEFLTNKLVIVILSQCERGVLLKQNLYIYNLYLHVIQ